MIPIGKRVLGGLSREVDYRDMKRVHSVVRA